ncbi:MAG: hypothetical protein IRY87_29925 [Acetobacteraceae bacterium]|nr:hypothetical protein [Acetobacteraceae bacterium]
MARRGGEAASPAGDVLLPRQLLLALALFVAPMIVAACGTLTPATTPPTYGSFKDSGGA